MLTLLLIPFVVAAERGEPIVVGGGAAATAGVAVPRQGVTTDTGGLPQVEGDLGFRSGSLSGRIDLDLAILLVDGHPTPVTLVPENAWIAVGGSDVSLAAGSFVGPWRIESVDPWDSALTSRSALSRHALPQAIAGGDLGWRGENGGIDVVGGVDLGAGIDLLAAPAAWAPGAPVLLGAYGHLDGKIFAAGAGGFWRPEARTGAISVDGRLDLAVVRADAQVVFGVKAPSGVALSAEVMPEFVLTPTARLEWYGQTPGGALGLAVRPVPFVRIAAEGALSDGLPQAWLSAEVFTPTTSRRKGVGGDVVDLGG